MSRRWRNRLIGFAASFVLLGLFTWVFRDPIFTASFAAVTSIAPGIECSQPKLEVDRAMEVVEIAPFDCTLSSGSMSALRTFTPMRVTFKGFEAPKIFVEHARVDKRERDLSKIETNTLGDIADVVGFRDELVKSMLDEAQDYDPHTPEIRIERLEAYRGGKQQDVLYGYRRSVAGEWSRTQAARVGSGTGPVEIRELDLRATPTRGEMRVGIYLGDKERGERPDSELRMTGKRLDRKNAAFELELKTPEQRSARAEPRKR